MITHIPEGNEAALAFKAGSGLIAKDTEQEVLDEIIRFFGDDATLLCFEKAGEFCHRRLVAEWIEKGTGVEVPELQF